MATPQREITIKEYNNEQPPGGGGYANQLANQGQRGDTELAHVNKWEEALLKLLGGSGSVNPKTGLKQYYLDPVAGDTYIDYAGRTRDSVTSAVIDDTTTSALDTTIDLPTDIYPYSQSDSTSQSTNQAQNYGINTSNQASQQSSQNYSGLPQQYQTSLLNAIIPSLTDAVKNMPQNIDTYTGQALSGYQNQMNTALKQNIPQILNALATRGTLNSTEGQRVLSNIMQGAAIDAGDKGYQTAMQAALLKANMPQILSQIAQLGQSSYGSSRGSSGGSSTGVTVGRSQGQSTADSSSYQEDPTVMYRTIADLLKAMM